MPTNFVLIFPDQWRGDALSHLGHPMPTPYADQLAAEGTSFRRAYSPAPTCTPARAVLATGRTPWNCGRLGYRDGLPWPYADTIAHRLCGAGYQTIQVGKTHYHPMRVQLGFEINRTYEASCREAGYISHYHQWLARETGGRVRDAALERNPNAWPVEIWEHEERLHNTRWIADEAIDCLTHRDPTRPFFLQVGFHRPHVPFDPPRRCWEALRDVELPPVAVGDWATEPATISAAHQSVGCLAPRQLDAVRRAYHANIAFVDEQIGRLQWWLARNGLDQDTWIILASDHGDGMGDHHRLYKSTFFEGSARIPLVVRPPRREGLARGQIRDELVDLADILPTCCAAAGLPADDVDGADLTPLLRGGDADWRTQWHGEHWSGQGMIYECWIDGWWKYIREMSSGREWLFDVHSDPTELHNAANDATHAHRLEAMRDALLRQLNGRGCGLVEDGAFVVGATPMNYRAEVLGQTASG